MTAPRPQPAFGAPSTRPQKPSLRRVARTLGWALLAFGAVWFWMEWDPDLFLQWKREIGPYPFFAALALLPAIGLPTTPFYVLAGATFPLWINSIGIPLSLAAHVLIVYGIAHSGLRGLAERALGRFGLALPALDPRRALRFAAMVKLTPGPPTFAKNYLIAFAGVPFPIYFAVCFGITLFYAMAFVLLGESILERDWTAGTLIAMGVLGLSALALLLLHRRLR